MSRSITIRGTISDEGKIKLFNRDALVKWAADNKGKDVLMEVEVRTSKRSNPQNRYMWGIVIPMIQAGLNDFGNEFSKEETHDFLKAKFNNKEIELTEGHYIDVPQSTTRLDTMGFMEYILKIQQFASEMLGLVIPDPNQL